MKDSSWTSVLTPENQPTVCNQTIVMGAERSNQSQKERPEQKSESLTNEVINTLKNEDQVILYPFVRAFAII